MIQDWHFARKRMTKKSWSTNTKLIISFSAIIVLLIFSSILANAVQENSIRRIDASVAENKVSLLILTIKGDLAESMLPAHDYLIDPKSKDEREYREQGRRIDESFSRLARAVRFEPVDRKLIKEAIDQFNQLKNIQNDIFALRGEAIGTLGPKKMEDMHVYQHAVLEKLEQLSNHEQAELADFLTNEQTASRRSILLIATATALALGGALLVGYLGSQM